MLGAGLPRGKARVVGQMGELRGLTETRPPLIGMGIDGQIAVLRVHNGIRLGGLPMTAAALAR